MPKHFEDAFRLLAPGTPLRQALESILRARTGALIILDDSEKVIKICEGGFRIDCPFLPAGLYELAKMDGAIILSADAKTIHRANTHIVPQTGIDSEETGIRHRIAQYVSRYSGALVVAISERRSVITLYKSNLKYVLQDTGVILSKANQALQTLEKYRFAFDHVLNSLDLLEFRGTVTLQEAARSVQRYEMVRRIAGEIEAFIWELGTEGRLINLQLAELLAGVNEEGEYLLRDYVLAADAGATAAALSCAAAEDIADLNYIAKAMGYSPGQSLDLPLTPRGYRILCRLPRLPFVVVDNLIKHFGNLTVISQAGIEELDQVEGIGEVRAKAIREGLKALYDQTLEKI